MHWDVPALVPLAGDRDRPGDQVDVFAADLGDLADPHAGVGAQQDHRAGSPVHPGRQQALRGARPPAVAVGAWGPGAVWRSASDRPPDVSSAPTTGTTPESRRGRSPVWPWTTTGLERNLSTSTALIVAAAGQASDDQDPLGDRLVGDVAGALPDHPLVEQRSIQVIASRAQDPEGRSRTHRNNARGRWAHSARAPTTVEARTRTCRPQKRDDSGIVRLRRRRRTECGPTAAHAAIARLAMPACWVSKSSAFDAQTCWRSAMEDSDHGGLLGLVGSPTTSATRRRIWTPQPDDLRDAEASIGQRYWPDSLAAEWENYGTRIRRLGVRIPPGALPRSVAPQPFRRFRVILVQDRIPLTIPLSSAVVR